MVHTITLKELRPQLPTVIDGIDKKLDRYVITRHGKPVAVLMSVDDYEGLLETIEILSDKETMKRIEEGKKAIREGRTVALEDIRKRLERV